MNRIPLPNKIYFTKDEGNESEVVIEPLYPGYGVTIGNALRRVLLGSLPGGAVTAVKIKGVDHEFSTIANVTEDVVDIILNLKKLRLRVHSDEPVRLELKSKGQKSVTAADIKSDSRVEIINKDLVIATLDSKSAEFVMELVAERGRGYVPVETRERESEKLEIGMIAVDAIYSPVRTVNFRVENVRVGQMTNFDKLTISMETDGTLGGREAMDMAAAILVEHFSLLLTNKAEDASEVSADADIDQEMVVSEAAEAVEEGTGLENLALSNRAMNALKRNNITTLERLKELSREDLENLEGLGEKSIEEILKIQGK